MTSAELKEIFKKKSKVAIVGFADSWNQAPFQNPEFEIWGLNSLFEIIPPGFSLWFETHDKKMWENNKEIGLGLTRAGKPYKEALASLPCTVLMVDKYPDIPNSMRFPLEEMITKFNPMRNTKEWKEYDFKGSKELEWNGYYSNSISYMISLAIDWAYEEIHIYGVDMATSTEYATQRSSCEYYIGVAAGRGIKVYIPPQSDLLKIRFNYGWEDEIQTAFDSKLATLNESMLQRFNMAGQQMDMSKKQLDQYIGAMEAIKEVRKIWSNLKG